MSALVAVIVPVYKAESYLHTYERHKGSNSFNALNRIDYSSYL